MRTPQTMSAVYCSLLQLSLIACLMLCSPGNASAEDFKTRRLPDSIHQKTRFLNADYLASLPANPVPEAKLPLLIFLHGAGGRGEDIQQVKRIATRAMQGLRQFGTEPCVFVAPQAKHGNQEIVASWLPEDLDRFLVHLTDTLPIDTSRVYLTGNSMGGYGTWAWAAHSPQHFAAVAPVVGGLGPGGPKDITADLDHWAQQLTAVPVWAFHGANDRVVPADRSERMVELIRNKGGQQARLTIYPDEGPGAGRRVYTSREFFTWLLAQQKASQ